MHRTSSLPRLQMDLELRLLLQGSPDDHRASSWFTIAYDGWVRWSSCGRLLCNDVNITILACVSQAQAAARNSRRHNQQEERARRCSPDASPLEFVRVDDDDDLDDCDTAFDGASLCSSYAHSLGNHAALQQPRRMADACGYGLPWSTLGACDMNVFAIERLQSPSRVLSAEHRIYLYYSRKSSDQ